MKTYSIVLIDEDPDEHFIVGSVVQGIQLITRYQCYTNAGELMAMLATGRTAAPDFVLLGASLPTAETALKVSNLRLALAGNNCEVVIYGIHNGFIQAFSEAHGLRFLHKSPSFEELHQQLIRLLDEQNEIGPMDFQSDGQVPLLDT